MNDQEAFAIAVEEAKQSFNEGGVPVSRPPIQTLLQRMRSAETLECQIGAALVSKDGKLLGRGHNMRVQLGSPIHHVSGFHLHSTNDRLVTCLVRERHLP
jgi:cytosine deaminase